MKPTILTTLLAVVFALGANSLPAKAQATGTTTETRGNVVTNTGTFNDVVINSTYAFTGVGVSGPAGNFQLDGTTITNLDGVVPPVTLQLILNSITYTEASVTGNGQTPSITFDLTPTLGNAGGNLPSMQVTLYASGPIANGVTENNVVFSLANAGSTPKPVVWTPVDESNPGNGGEGNGQPWNESLSNLEPNPDELISTSGAENFDPDSIQNQNFTFGGTVEVVYATPEPSALALTVAAGALFAVLRRRQRLKA